MPMKVEFFGNTADEMNEAVKDYASKIKGTRGGKNREADDAVVQQTGTSPAPMGAPQGGFNPGTPQQASFNPQSAPQGGFNPGAAQPGGPGPEIQALVARIVPRIDGALTSGQPPEQVLNWFRGQCGPEAANATLDQIKTVFLYKLSAPALETIAKLMNA